MHTDDRILAELHCLTRSLNPMVEGAVGWYRKILTLILVLVWSILVLDLTTAEPSQFINIGLTAFVFLLVGRMWGVEANRLLSTLNPITITLGDNDE